MNLGGIHKFNHILQLELFMRVEMHDQLVWPAVPHVRGIPDRRLGALPIVRAEDLKYPVGVCTGEGDGVYGLPAFDVGTEEQCRRGDQQFAHLPRDGTEHVAGFGRCDVVDGPAARIVRFGWSFRSQY